MELVWSGISRFLQRCFIILLICGISLTLAACGSLERPAPELTGTKPLNSDAPVTLAVLRGKIVVLDFWSYSCVNCLKTIAPLQNIEQQFKNDVVFIGVHSPKYDSEKPDRCVRSAMRRFGIDHLVVNDPETVAWKNYAVDVWPTFIVIDTQGHIVHQFTGDRCLPALANALATLAKKEREAGRLDRNNNKVALVKQEKSPRSIRLLNSPGKIVADPKRHQLYVSSTGNNQILVIQIGKDGSANATAIGTGAAGLVDGTFDACQFQHPEGLAVDGDKLYVADTDNHAIRMVDLQDKTVTTIAGDGQPRNTREECKLLACHAKLDSPWDLVVVHGKIYIAMAGAHQIWCLEPDANSMTRVAGSGNEQLADGKGTAASLAQPSGLATDGSLLYFADSESNAVRQVNPQTGEVSTISGKALNICGDKDGKCDQALFRHPEGLVVGNDKLYVADSFNNKIRCIGLKERTAATVAGSGEAGAEDGTFATFSEPSGLAILGDRLYVADRANDAIRVIDLANSVTSTLDLSTRSLRAPSPTSTGASSHAEKGLHG